MVVRCLFRPVCSKNLHRHCCDLKEHVTVSYFCWGRGRGVGRGGGGRGGRGSSRHHINIKKLSGLKQGSLDRIYWNRFVLFVVRIALSVL